MSWHTANNPDPMKRPTFGFTNRLRRVIWYCTYAILFKPSPIPFYGWRTFLLRLFGAKIGKSNFIYPSAKVWAPWLLETEDVVTIGRGVEVYNPGGVKLAHHTIIAQDAYLCGATHDYNKFTFDYISKPIESEPYAWVCAHAIVLPGVRLGEGCVLGAGAVTSKSLEPWTVYAGNPSKAVAKRNWFDTKAQPESLTRGKSD